MTIDLLERVQSIVALTCKRPQPLARVLAQGRLTQKQFQGAVDEAAKRGYSVRVRDGMVSSAVAVGPRPEPVVLGDAKPGRHQVCYFTDTHFGCRHCAEDSLLEFWHRCWDRGARVGVCTGDLLDGNRGVLLADQDYIGYDSQKERLKRLLRKAPPMKIVAVDGNHDGYLSASMGTQCGALLAEQLQAAGYQWHFAGMCEGRAIVHGANVFLWHPAGGSSSREGVRKVLTDKIRNTQEPMDVLLMGHLHKHVALMVYPENVFAACGGTFQRQKSEFSNRMSDPWDVGGLLLSWETDKSGRPRAFAAEQMLAGAK